MIVSVNHSIERLGPVVYNTMSKHSFVKYARILSWSVFIQSSGRGRYTDIKIRKGRIKGSPNVTGTHETTKHSERKRTRLSQDNGNRKCHCLKLRQYKTDVFGKEHTRGNKKEAIRPWRRNRNLDNRLFLRIFNSSHTWRGVLEGT